MTRTDMSPTPEPNLDLEMNVSTSSAKLEQNTNASLTPLASRNSNTYASIGDWHNGNNTLGVSKEIGRHVLVKESARMRACNSFSFCLNSIVQFRAVNKRGRGCQNLSVRDGQFRVCEL